MRSTKLIAAVSLGLALVACGKKEESSSATATNDSSMNIEAKMSASGMNGSTAAALPAQGFVDVVAGSDMYELQSGKLAQTMGSSAGVKQFGQMLITDHTKSSTNLKAAAKETSPVVALPMTLPADLKAKVDALKAAKGAEFDRLFIQQQTDGHRLTLDTLNAYAAGGDQASLKSFATASAPVVQSHLTQLEAMPK